MPAVELFDTASNRSVGSLDGPGEYYDSRLRRDRSLVGCARCQRRSPGYAVVWDVDAGGSPKSFGPAIDFELAADGTTITVLNADGVGLRVFDLATGRSIGEIDTPAGVQYWDLEIDPTGRAGGPHLLPRAARRRDRHADG